MGRIRGIGVLGGSHEYAISSVVGTAHHLLGLENRSVLCRATLRTAQAKYSNKP